MTPTLLIPLVALLIFALGVLVGSGQVTRAQDARGRRQAAVQRELNVWIRALHEMADRQAAKEEELRWRYLEQSGLVVLDYDEDKEVSTKDHQPPLPPRRPAQ